MTTTFQNHLKVDVKQQKLVHLGSRNDFHRLAFFVSMIFEFIIFIEVQVMMPYHLDHIDIGTWREMEFATQKFGINSFIWEGGEGREVAQHPRFNIKRTFGFYCCCCWGCVHLVVRYLCFHSKNIVQMVMHKTLILQMFWVDRNFHII